MVGEYERKDRLGDTHREAILKNGVLERESPFSNAKWTMSKTYWAAPAKGEIHFLNEDGSRLIRRINKDGSLTDIAVIGQNSVTGLLSERQVIPQEYRNHLKKIK